MLKYLYFFIAFLTTGDCYSQTNIQLSLSETKFNGFNITTANYNSKYVIGINEKCIAVIDINNRKILRTHLYNSNADSSKEVLYNAYLGLDSSSLFINYCSGKLEIWNWVTDSLKFEFTADNGFCGERRWERVELSITEDYNFLYQSYSGFPLDIIGIKNQKQFTGDSSVNLGTFKVHMLKRLSMMNLFNLSKRYCYVKESGGNKSEFIDLENFKILKTYIEPNEALAGEFTDKNDDLVEVVQNVTNKAYYFKYWKRKKEHIYYEYQKFTKSYKSYYILQNICVTKDCKTFFYTKGSEKKLYVNTWANNKVITKIILNNLIDDPTLVAVNSLLLKDNKKLIVYQSPDKLTLIDVVNLNPVKTINKIVTIYKKVEQAVLSTNGLDFKLINLNDFKTIKDFKNSYPYLSNDGKLIFVYSEMPLHVSQEGNFNYRNLKKLIDIIETKSMKSVKFW